MAPVRDATKTFLRNIMANTKAKMLETATHYGLPHESLEERHWSKLNKVLGALTVEEAYVLSRKAVQCVEFTCYYAWAKGRIPGPATEENLTKKAHQAERLAQFQEKLGRPDAAEKQLQRAAKLLQEVQEMREAKLEGKPPQPLRKHPKHPLHASARRVRRVVRQGR